MNDESLELSLANELREIAGVAAKIDEFCASHDVGHVAYAVNLAIDEILTNTISYGYEDDERRRIEVIVRLEPEALVVVIVDDSLPFDLALVPERDIEGASLEDMPLGGLGIFLVHQMMDSVDYRREEGCNVVTLIKNTAEAESPPPDADAETNGLTKNAQE